MKNKYLSLLLAGILYQGQAMAVEPLTIETDGFGFMNHSFYVIPYTTKAYEVDLYGHESVNAKYKRILLLSEPSNAYKLHTLLAPAKTFPPFKPIAPYQVIQESLPQPHYIGSSQSIGRIHKNHQALNVVFIQRCSIYLLGNSAYEGCIAE